MHSAEGISARDILLVICLGPDVALNKSKIVIIIIITITLTIIIIIVIIIIIMWCFAELYIIVLLVYKTNFHGTNHSTDLR